MTIIVFDPTAFKLTYPEFAGVDDARCTIMFTIAEQSLLDNTDNSPVMDGNYRTQLFYMLVAHLLYIFGTSDTPDASDSTPPGRISSATEGTVTSAFEYILPAGSAMAAWFIQSKYGAMYWTATARFRSARYYGFPSGVGTAQAYGAPVVIPGPGGV
jgi:hypothetical protein